MATLQQAIRTFNRLYGQYVRTGQQGWDADQMMDGGEWSGPAIADAQEEEWHRLLTYVCARYGLSMATLENAVIADSYRSDEMYMKSKGC